MDLKMIYTLYTNKNKSVFRNQNIFNMIIIGIKLKIGEFFGGIYIKEKIFEKNILDLTTVKNSMRYFDSLIRDTVDKQPIQNIINFKKKGIENIGAGCVFIPAIFGEMIVFTQKEADFYFKINMKQNLTLKIQLISVPKISGTIMIEKKPIGKFSLSSFKEKELLMKIDSNLINDKIMKIKISVDKCWNIHHIYELFPNFPLGVGIKQVEILGN